MTTKLNFGRDVQGYNAFAPSPSTNMYSATLASGGNSTITLPGTSQSWIVSFSYQPGSNVWVAYNGSASVPAGATFASNTSELLPGSRTLPALQNNGTSATTINLLNNGAGTADIGVVLYAHS
jgi:hypothetical protein